MNRPSGAVTSRIARKKTPICSHPLDVTSEPLGFDQRVGQVDKQAGCDDQADHIVDGHFDLPKRSHATAYNTLPAKNTIVVTLTNMSMAISFAEGLIECEDCRERQQTLRRPQRSVAVYEQPAARSVRVHDDQCTRWK